MYLENRSLFIDEACVSYQLIERDFIGLFDNLKYQYAPPLFLVLVKSITVLLGEQEYALRLLPLLAALGSIPLFYQLCKQFLETRYAIFPLYLFCFGMPMLQYATEVKQYSLDVLITIALVLLAIKQVPKNWTTKWILLWSVLGGIVVWLSMPSVFILFAVGVSWWYTSYLEKDWNAIKKTLWVIPGWLGSFAIYYFAIIHNDIGLEGLEQYHSRFFLPLPPTNAVELNQFYELLLTFYRTSMGATFLAIAFGILTTFLGGYDLRIKKQTPVILLLSLPILAAMLASGFYLYSLIPRLTLFLMPLLLLMIGLGQAWLLERSPLILKGAWVAIMIIIGVNEDGYRYFGERFQIEELRPVLEQVHAKWQEGDQAYLHAQATHAYTFYSQYHEEAESMDLPNIQIGHWSDRPAKLDFQDAERLWLIFSHVDRAEVDAYVKELGQGRSEEIWIEEYGAWGVLLTGVRD